MLPLGTERGEFASMSVMVPVVVLPFTCTVTPIMGSPCWSVTVPLACVCAIAAPVPIRIRASNIINLFFILL